MNVASGVQSVPRAVVLSGLVSLFICWGADVSFAQSSGAQAMPSVPSNSCVYEATIKSLDRYQQSQFKKHELAEIKQDALYKQETFWTKLSAVPGGVTGKWMKESERVRAELRRIVPKITDGEGWVALVDLEKKEPGEIDALAARELKGMTKALSVVDGSKMRDLAKENHRKAIYGHYALFATSLRNRLYERCLNEGAVSIINAIPFENLSYYLQERVTAMKASEREVRPADSVTAREPSSKTGQTTGKTATQLQEGKSD